MTNAEAPIAPKARVSLWFDRQAEDAARFYSEVVPGSRVTDVSRCGPGGPWPEGEVLTVSFTVAGIDCVGINGGPAFALNEAFSFVLECDGQEELDKYWNALIADGGAESQCGWCTDRFGVSWQVLPRNLGELLSSPAAVQAMLGMGKLDIAALKAAALRAAGAAEADAPESSA